MGMFKSKSGSSNDTSPERQRTESTVEPLEAHEKTRWERSWPVIACGAGLFSDGYLNG
jgi:hypothetical protein